jgi:glucosamine--fructose-6-phosphate aminotransferase (isomerizing)
LSISTETSGGRFEQEILEQPEAIRRQLELGRPSVEAIAAEIRRRAPHTLVIAARGSSDNAGRYAQYVFGAHNRRLVSLAAPSLFTLYRAPPDLSGTLVIGVSQSGRSPDIVAVLEEARRQGVHTVAVTRDAGSPLAQVAAQSLLLQCGEELAIAATKSYTCQLVALAMLSTALAGDAARWAELAGLPDAVQAAIDASLRPAEQAARFRQAERFVVIGRGYNYATAFEVSLKIQEASYAMAEAYSAADFWHGPAAMVDRGFPVLLVAPSGEPLGDVTALRDLCVRRRADLIAISDHEEVLAHAAARLPLPSGVREWLSPVTAVVPGQLFALHLARARGLDPDRPRGLRKITETR